MKQFSRSLNFSILKEVVRNYYAIFLYISVALFNHSAHDLEAVENVFYTYEYDSFIKK